MKTIFVQKFAYFMPSAENPREMPKLDFVDSLFKRRLSQISRMTIQVVHDVMDCAENSKIVFVSFRGEINRQFKINKGLVEDFEVLPANFSISVFNTPPAVATIALGIKAGYTAIFPGEDNFFAAFAAACAPIFCGKEKTVLFVYADECVLDEYKNVLYNGQKMEKMNVPLAFAGVLSAENNGNSIEISLDSNSDLFSSPKDFLEGLCRKR